MMCFMLREKNTFKPRAGDKCNLKNYIVYFDDAAHKNATETPEGVN